MNLKRETQLGIYVDSRVQTCRKYDGLHRAYSFFFSQIVSAVSNTNNESVLTDYVTKLLRSVLKKNRVLDGK